MSDSKGCSRLKRRVAALESQILALKQQNRELSAELAASRKLAYIDELTGTNNRRFLEETLVELEDADEMFCIAIIDLDHFKLINDQHGHVGGDRALRKLGGILLAERRGDDCVVRYGGDEFVVVLRNCTREGAKAYLHRLHAYIQRELKVLDSDGSLFLATVSIGFEECRPGMGSKFSLDRADQALYKAKHAGRDCVMAAH